jgi:hypothetical protein
VVECPSSSNRNRDVRMGHDSYDSYEYYEYYDDSNAFECCDSRDVSH